MFQFPRCPSYGYVFTVRCRCITTGGLPHSEIPGSKPACGSPRHIGAYPVLHRLLAPRHPPCALVHFIYSPTKKIMVVYHYLFDVSRISIGTHVLPQCIAYATHCVLMCYPFNTVQLSRCNVAPQYRGDTFRESVPEN